MNTSWSYEDYLKKHKSLVISTYEKVFVPVLKSEGKDTFVLEDIRRLLEYHDKSKLNEPEFSAYSDHWNAGNSHTYGKDLPEYQIAWNHHQKSNPHHWQYWVLLRDSEVPHQIALDMPLEYIIEMICDWQSASILHANNTAIDWYESQKSNMILSDNTRKLVEHYLTYIPRG